jgi:hypothetical protein
MNTPSPWLRPLQVLAAGLALAIAVLFWLWVQKEPAPALAKAPDEQASGPAATTAAAANGAPIAAPAATDAPTSLPAAPTAPTAAAEDRAVLYGTASSADGTPLRNGVFWLYRDGKHVGTASGDLAAFAFGGLQPGLHKLRSRIDDELPIELDVEVKAPATRLDIELPERWLLTVNVLTPDGQPWLEAVRKQTPMARIEALVALAFDAPLAGDLPASNQGEVDGGLGRFRSVHMPFERGNKAMPKQTLGVLTLPPGRPAHVALILRQTLVAQQAANPGQQELTFTLPVEALLGKLAKVRMRLVDAKGAPVAKANVALNDAQTGGGGRPTGDDGRVTLENLVPGRLGLGIWAKELSAPSVAFVVPPGADLDLGDIVLQSPTTIELQFDNFGGKGSVRCSLLDEVRPGWIGKDLYFSAENGKSQSYPLFPGRYGMLATGPAGVAMTVLDLRSPPAGPVRFDLRRGAELRLEYAFGPTKTAYEVTSAEGVLVRRREVSGSGGENVELPPGGYTVRVTDQGGATARRDFTLPPAGMTLKLP